MTTLRATWAIIATVLSACASPDIDPINPETRMEIAAIASKACTEQFGSMPEFAVGNWRVRADRGRWMAETPNTNGPPAACRYGIYISMSDRTTDFLGCLLICVTA